MSEFEVGETVWPVRSSHYVLFGPQTVLASCRAPRTGFLLVWLMGHDGFGPIEARESDWTRQKPTDDELAARRQRRAERAAEDRALLGVLFPDGQEGLTGDFKFDCELVPWPLWSPP